MLTFALTKVLVTILNAVVVLWRMSDPAIISALIGATSTLATGLAAVGAATWVGRKQAAIAEATLRSGAFDRRMSVYVTTMTYIANMNNMRMMRNAQFYEKFALKVEEGQFLFLSHVKVWLRDVQQSGNRLAIAYDLLLKETDKDIRAELDREIQDILLKRTKFLAEMSSVFAKDLTI